MDFLCPERNLLVTGLLTHRHQQNADHADHHQHNDQLDVVSGGRRTIGDLLQGVGDLEIKTIVAVANRVAFCYIPFFHGIDDRAAIRIQVQVRPDMAPIVAFAEEHDIRSYFDQKGMHMQFNVVTRETLLDAQKHPENYKTLVVRVAGYSALFTTLSKSLQDDIINRTQQGF